MKKVVVGSRDSKLALLQAGWVISKLKEVAPATEFIIKKIKTSGDRTLQASLPKTGDKGLFVKELEMALLEGEIDLAVHSMKDLPTTIRPELHLAAVTEREDPRDAVVGENGRGLAALPAEARVGTSSLRRIAQLLHFRPDLAFEPVRGNIETRLRKLREGRFAALILAYAGMKRLGCLEYIAEVIPLEICLPAVGQGALGIEIRRGEVETEALVSRLNDRPSFLAVTAERSFLHRLEGGCQVPVAALAKVEAEELHLQGVVASPDGATILRGEERGPLGKAQAVGRALAEKLLSDGAADILREIRGGTGEDAEEQ